MKRDKNPLDVDLKVNYTTDVYRWYVEEQLKKNPKYFTKYDKTLSMKGIKLLMTTEANGKESIVMSYTMFRAIIEKVNKLIVETLLRGEKIYFGKSLGHIQGSRIERNYNKKIINYTETNKLRAQTGDETVKVYHTSDTYCRIAWKKLRTLANSSIYEFKPTKGFRKTFSRTLIENPLLQYQFTLYKRA